MIVNFFGRGQILKRRSFFFFPAGDKVRARPVRRAQGYPRAGGQMEGARDREPQARPVQDARGDPHRHGQGQRSPPQMRAILLDLEKWL